MGYLHGLTGRGVAALLLSLCLLAVVVARADAATVRVATSGDGKGVVRIEASNIPPTWNPTGYWGDCPPDCEPVKVDDAEIRGLSTVMVFTARPAEGSTFAGWSGACAGTAPVCRVPLVGLVQATAKFIRDPASNPPPRPRPQPRRAPLLQPTARVKCITETGFTSGARAGAYTYFTSLPGLRSHLGQPGGVPRVLVPPFSFPDATVMVRFDALSGWWRTRFALHAGCTNHDDWGESHGVLGWTVMTHELRGSEVPVLPGGYVTKRLNLGGRIVTRLTPRRNQAIPDETIYTFRDRGLLYHVNGSRPNLPRGTDEQHAAWVEQQIRNARYVGR
jgi:hypothetical protein